MAAHQAMAMMPLLPIAVPKRQTPKSVHDWGEWLVLAEPAQPGVHTFGGHEAAAEEWEEQQGQRQVAGAFHGLGNKTECADSQVRARSTGARSPITDSHSIGPAVGRKPTRSATPSTTATASIVWIRLPRTCRSIPKRPLSLLITPGSVTSLRSVRVWIDEDVCVGTGLCEMTCPEVFEVSTVAEVRVEFPQDSLHDQVRDAADECPTGAIHVEE